MATGSARRRAQLANLRPDLGFVGLRGNMAKRLSRAGDGTVAAVVAAAAALDRLGWGSKAAQRLSPLECLPQVGQGALALECREDDAECAALLSEIDDHDAHRALDAERGFLRALGAGCAVPAGALASSAGGTVEIVGMLASGDGRVIVRSRLAGAEPGRVGEELARALVGEKGASSLAEWEELAELSAGAAHP